MIYDAEVYVVKEAVKVVVRKSGSNLMDLLESKPDILSSFRIFSKYTLPIEVGGSSRRVAFTLGENFSGLHQIQTKKMAQKGPQTSFMFSSRYDTIYKGIHGPSPPPLWPMFGEIFGHNRSRSLVFPSPTGSMWHHPVFSLSIYEAHSLKFP